MIPQTPTETAARHAVGWRMWVAPFTIMLCTLLSYIDRQVLAVLSPMILAETGLSAASYTTAISVFSIAYMIGNPLWGSFLDYIGLRRGMVLSVAWWTLASTAHAWVSGFLGFAVARGFLGFGEGAVFPGALRTAVEALPVNRQSRGMALGYSGASLGALITPVIVTPLAIWLGWRVAFLLTGALGVAWILLWLVVAKAPFLPGTLGGAGGIEWPDVRDRRVWVVVSSFGLGGLALGVAAYLSPLYLNRVLGLSQEQLGYILWIPMLGWEIGYFFWGWVADRFAANEDRPVRIFVLLTALSLPTALMTLTTSWGVVVALFFWATFVADGFVVMSLRVGSRIFPKDRTGMVAGIGSGSWALVQAVILPVYGQWFDRQWYTATFVSMSLLPLVGTLFWLRLSRPWARTLAPAEAT
jgi:ACS family hexuronate transporter-like MFS transporter